MGSIEESQQTMATRYLVKKASTKQEMDEILDVIWAANYTPYEPFVQIFFPVLGYMPADREASLAESKERFWSQHKANPASNWIYVVDVDTGKLVGTCQWEIYNKNPFPEGPPKLTAPWWPKGEHREFVELILNQVYKPRANWMTRPHLAINWMAVHPSHRRLGIGSLLMDWGIQRADTLNYECWLEASLMGKPLYSRFGFRSLLMVAFDTDKKDASDVWRKTEHEMKPAAFSAMWRPKQGLWEAKANEGGIEDVKLPWALGVE